MAAEGEVSKLQRHLKLLREEYVKLQAKCVELERDYQILAAGSTTKTKDTFVSRMMKTIANLFEKDLYSDMTIVLDGQHIRAHRFVLACRGDSWGVSLADVDQLDMSDISRKVAYTILKWAYTDELEPTSDEEFILSLMKVASRYKLTALVERCEYMLMSSVDVRNCIKLYTIAEEIDALSLKNHCSELISCHWDDFTDADFVHMSAPLLYKMFKSKCSHPLHMAIRMRREDVVFLFFIEFYSQLPVKLNEVDTRGDLALDLALIDRQESIAQSLISNHVDVDARDRNGRTLLHRAIEREDEYSATFLLNNGASVNEISPDGKRTPLHLVALVKKPENEQGMARVSEILLKRGANPNARDYEGNSVLHVAVSEGNRTVFSVLLKHIDLELESKNISGHTVLWLALEAIGSSSRNAEDFAAQLIERGASPDAIDMETGDSLLHRMIRAGNEKAALFLASHGAKINNVNMKGETALHVACASGLASITAALLQKGGNPNHQTSKPILPPEYYMSEAEERVEFPVYKQTPLHLAILNKHDECIRAILDHKSVSQLSSDNNLIVPNFNVCDSDGQTALGLALCLGLHPIAQTLLSGGANVNVKNANGMTLLHQAIIHQQTEGALFLLENDADVFATTDENKTPLQLAVEQHLPKVVEALCQRGSDVNVKDDDGNLPIWLALQTGQEDVASVLALNDCDVDGWGAGPDGCMQTMLHRAIDENNESVAGFLIRCGCDLDVPRRPGLDGRGGDEAFDQQVPLHLACAWGQEHVVQTLLEHNANVNVPDAEGKTPLHVAILNQHPGIISLLLSQPTINLNARDKHGQTPFTVAMITKNNKAAQAILQREPQAAEQYNNKGQNFLHVAIQKSDIESVLFLLGVHVNVNSRVQDSSNLTPLHLAVIAGSELIVRNLLLAYANVNDVTPQKQTSLHLAAAHDRATICSILLANSIHFDAVDDNLNNALHIAVQKGHLATVKILLTESGINAEAVNLRGQNPLHYLAQHGKENSAAIFDFFMECMPEYPVNKPDAEGNTPLLLAYMNGNGPLCRAIVRVGACLGKANHHGISIFNCQVATKQLLFRLLDLLSKEPPWSEGDVCLECGTKFNLATRKHHCRHCGRLLCSKCSDREMPILKYNLNKPVRVCELCFDVLTLGAAAAH